MAKAKFYTVWKGACPGVYSSWQECQLQIKGFKGALYKSFDTKEEAERALNEPACLYVGNAVAEPPEYFNKNCLVVDAACSGNPGPMEYRGIYLATGQQIFHYGPIYGTNNIGEFLAIVHGLALIKQKGLQMPIYSDSLYAIKWIKNKKCKTQLERTQESEKVYKLVERAEKWLQENTYDTPVLKWETKQWGEIPADFGRK